MKQTLHRWSGGLALCLLTGFWLSTLISELSGQATVIRAVKTGILYALPLMIAALALTGASGMAIGRQRKGPLIAAKTRRMALAAANGLLILAPAAVFLYLRAKNGAFDTAFYGVQGVELTAGAVNMWLLGLNMRDGLKMASSRKR